MSKILCVDDEKFILTALRRVLGRNGHEIIFAENGAEGIAKMREGGIDLIVSDIRMPGMSGVEMVANLRESGCKIPIIYLSGDTGEHEGLVQQQLLDEVVQAFVHKPFSMEDLRILVNKLLGASAATSD